MKVSMFVHNLSGNPVGRAVPIAHAIQCNFDVELLGFLFDENEVHAPHRGLFEYKTLRSSRNVPALLRNIPRLANRASGDIIYACKPLMSSFGPALYAARVQDDKPLFLDVEDDEWVPMGDSVSEFLYRDVLRGWKHGTAWKYTLLLHPLTHLVDGVTVVSQKMQRRYGGLLLRHGPDEDMFDPAKFDRVRKQQLREKWNVTGPDNIALFAGTPRPHKDLDTLKGALCRPQCKNWAIILLGPKKNPSAMEMKRQLGPRCHLLGYRSYEIMPELLAMADAVPVPQRNVSFAESQVPAKLLDALAMECPVVGSEVGDIPSILGKGQRGWLIPPENEEELASALLEIAERPGEAKRRARRGRKWYLKNASSTAIQSRLEKLISIVTKRYKI